MAIRNDSVGIETYSPYQDRDITDISVCDLGDLEFPFGNPKKALDIIENTVKTILDANKIPCMLGGEHLVTLGAVSAVVKRYPDVHILHLDAHADLRDTYLDEPLSHATVMRRIWELVGDQRIYQCGIRSGEKEEFSFAKDHTVMQKWDLKGFADVVKSLKRKPVYVSLDLDILDPGIFSGTGTPEAGGVSFTSLLDALLQLHSLSMVGCDINELSPCLDPSGVSTAVACKLTREILLMLKGE
jgi:agmatinase